MAILHINTLLIEGAKQIIIRLLLNNIEFKEDKGLIDSIFMVKCDYEKYNLIVKYLNDGLNN
jgi:hypothetical protein